MTAVLDRPPAPQPDTPTGARERGRPEQGHRSRRRHRRVAAAAGAALVVLVAVVLAAGLASRDAPARPAPEPERPVAGDASEAVAAPLPPDAGSEAVAAPLPADAGSDSRAPADERARVQLLNGVGAPGVAEEVAELLPEAEFRVVVADNAPAFGVRETRVLVYDDDPASLATAERLREVLGAGTISVSRQPQSVVDVTVIIGRDVRGVS